MQCFDIPGPSRSPAPTHCSYVYINEDKPKWNETVKVQSSTFPCVFITQPMQVRLPTIVPDDCLFLRMCYHVRRSVDKHKSEKVGYSSFLGLAKPFFSQGPFALSYLKILDSGEIIQDKEHEPYVYKVIFFKF